MDRDALLDAYGRLWGPEAGPFNLSAEGKYLEYAVTRFFEENFTVPEGARVCNIGIGAGYWDRYLSYCLRGGELTSIDILPECCEALRAGLENEGNPNNVMVLCGDFFEIELTEGGFDLVTAVGSTLRESGRPAYMAERALGLLKPSGCMYIETLSVRPEELDMEALCRRRGGRIDISEADNAYGIDARFWKITRE